MNFQDINPILLVIAGVIITFVVAFLVSRFIMDMNSTEINPRGSCFL